MQKPPAGGFVRMTTTISVILNLSRYGGAFWIIFTPVIRSFASIRFSFALIRVFQLSFAKAYDRIKTLLEVKVLEKAGFFL